MIKRLGLSFLLLVSANFNWTWRDPFQRETRPKYHHEKIEMQVIVLNASANVVLLKISGESYVLSRGERAGNWEVLQIRADGVVIRNIRTGRTTSLQLKGQAVGV